MEPALKGFMTGCLFAQGALPSLSPFNSTSDLCAFVVFTLAWWMGLVLAADAESPNKLSRSTKPLVAFDESNSVGVGLFMGARVIAVSGGVTGIGALGC